MRCLKSMGLKSPINTSKSVPPFVIFLFRGFVRIRRGREEEVVGGLARGTDEVVIIAFFERFTLGGGAVWIIPTHSGKSPPQKGGVPSPVIKGAGCGAPPSG